MFESLKPIAPYFWQGVATLGNVSGSIQFCQSRRQEATIRAGGNDMGGMFSGVGKLTAVRNEAVQLILNAETLSLPKKMLYLVPVTLLTNPRLYYYMHGVVALKETNREFLPQLGIEGESRKVKAMLSVLRLITDYHGTILRIMSLALAVYQFRKGGIHRYTAVASTAIHTFDILGEYNLLNETFDHYLNDRFLKGIRKTSNVCACLMGGKLSLLYLPFALAEMSTGMTNSVVYGLDRRVNQTHACRKSSTSPLNVTKSLEELSDLTEKAPGALEKEFGGLRFNKEFLAKTKATIFSSEAVEQQEFKTLLADWDAIVWDEKNYNLLTAKIAAETDRNTQQFPEGFGKTQKERTSLKKWLLQKENREEVLRWARNELSLLCEGLEGKRLIPGDKTALTWARVEVKENILAMNKMRERGEPVIPFDMLLRFSIEVGSKCVNALTRVLDQHEEIINLEFAWNDKDSSDLSLKRSAIPPILAKGINRRVKSGLDHFAQQLGTTIPCLDFQDVHLVNFVHRNFGRFLGISVKSAEGDDTFSENLIVRVMTTVFNPLRYLFQSSESKASDLKRRASLLKASGGLIDRCKAAFCDLKVYILELQPLNKIKAHLKKYSSQDGVNELFGELIHSKKITAATLEHWWLTDYASRAGIQNSEEAMTTLKHRIHGLGEDGSFSTTEKPFFRYYDQGDNLPNDYIFFKLDEGRQLGIHRNIWNYMLLEMGFFQPMGPSTADSSDGQGKLVSGAFLKPA